LFDLVNGLYLVDSRHIEKAFKYLRTAELSYLEAYEKYFILYNALSAREYKMAINYLWLFQKLNTSSIASMDISKTTSAAMLNFQANDQNVFRYVDKNGSFIKKIQTRGFLCEIFLFFTHLNNDFLCSLASTIYAGQMYFKQVYRYIVTIMMSSYYFISNVI